MLPRNELPNVVVKSGTRLFPTYQRSSALRPIHDHTVAMVSQMGG